MVEESHRVDAQHALDELFEEHLIPFKLSAQVVEAIGLQEYIIRFYDSRLNSIIVSWYQGLSFQAVCRAAVLERMKTFSGSLSATAVCL